MEAWVKNFIHLCEESGSAISKMGWTPHHFKNENQYSFAYIKKHSYGEFIFDWSWAELYGRFGIDYYPKLVHCVPFTPVNLPKIRNPNKRFIESIHKEYQLMDVNSHHFLFSEDEIHSDLEALGYFKMLSTQYHFNNRWKNFDDFMLALKSRKRKQIKKERQAVAGYDVEIQRVPVQDIDSNTIEEIYKLYVTTVAKKHSNVYLSKEFFLGLKKDLPNSFFYLAYSEEKLLAMSFFIEDKKNLYGRYWGIDFEKEQNFQYLHFEMCYYLAMEYCMEKGISNFEAGAQGEQKLLRGFEPVVITSHHHLKIQQLHKLIGDQVQEFNQRVLEEHKYLNQHLPFKLK